MTDRSMPGVVETDWITISELQRTCDRVGVEIKRGKSYFCGQMLPNCGQNPSTAIDASRAISEVNEPNLSLFHLLL